MSTRTKIAWTAAVLLAAACIWFATRTPSTDTPRGGTTQQLPADGERRGHGVGTDAAASAADAVHRVPAAKPPPSGVPTGAGSKVLRVVLEGITEQQARMATITATAVEESARRPRDKVRDAWSGQGLTTEVGLDPFLTRAAQRPNNLRNDEFELRVDHPLHFSETTRVSLSNGVEREGGQTLYEVRVHLAEVFFWPEFTLIVRDAQTRAHLEDVELRGVPTAFMGLAQQPGAGKEYTPLGDGLSSPITLIGGRKADEAEDHAAGIALQPKAGEPPQPAELIQSEENQRGIMVYARAPGYAWGRIVLDVSKGAARELLLERGAALDVRFVNVQFDGYAALGKPVTLCIARINPDGSEDGVLARTLDETVATDGLHIDGLELGKHAVSVELGRAFTWRKRPVLAHEELTLAAAGGVREVVLVLADSPTPPERTTLGGQVSFPTFGGEHDVRLQLYKADYMYGDPDFEYSLTDMEPIPGARPTWSFRLEDLPVGLYQARLMPFEKNWMIELPAGGRNDVAFVLLELAELFVETVDARSGEVVPLEVLRYGSREVLPGQVHEEWSSARTSTHFEGQPGRFRIWTAPGPAFIRTHAIPSELNLGSRGQDLDLVPGLQSVRLELAPSCTLRFEFRVGGAALPHDDSIFTGLSQCIRPVGHDGRVGHMTYWILEASEPGVYEISFEGIGADRFLPIRPRRVDVRAGETTEVVVNLRRK